MCVFTESAVIFEQRRQFKAQQRLGVVSVCEFVGWMEVGRIRVCISCWWKSNATSQIASIARNLRSTREKWSGQIENSDQMVRSLLYFFIMTSWMTNELNAKNIFSSTDMWGLGCLVWESFNGPLKNRSNLKDIDNVSWCCESYSLNLFNWSE